jgi:Carbohydrate-binding family 9
MKSILSACQSISRTRSLLFPHWTALAIMAGSLSLFPVGGAERSPASKKLPLPKQVIVPKLYGTVKVDGELSESVWKKAAVLKPFYRNDGSGREREQTQVRLWYNDTALFLAWTCQDADIQATFTQRDSKFWEEEVVEFFVTAKELTRYFELQWNPLGGVFDAIIDNNLDEHGVSKDFRGDWSFTAKGMKSAVKLKGTVGNSSDKDEFWQVEVMLPFADLGQATPSPKDVWRANFYRFNRSKGQPVEQLSWSPTLSASFHQPGRFGYLEFGR